MESKGPHSSSHTVSKRGYPFVEKVRQKKKAATTVSHDDRGSDDDDDSVKTALV